ncbi:MAG: hypothetical protein RH946_00840 [Rhodospirillales bacterium]
MSLYIDINNQTAVPVPKPRRVPLLSQPEAVVGCAHWTDQELAELAGFLVVDGYDPRLHVATGGATDNEDGTATPNTDDKALADLQAEGNRLLVSALEGRMSALVSGAYGPHERETWRKQEDEARAYTADDQAPTPYLDGIRLAGETLAEQVAAIMAKVTAIETATQALLLRKRELLVSLYACEDAANIATWLDDELNTGWPA